MRGIVAPGVLAAILILVIGPGGGLAIAIAATGLIYLSYLMTNIGVLAARFRGWPRKDAWFKLGRGKLANIVGCRLWRADADQHRTVAGRGFVRGLRVGLAEHSPILSSMRLSPFGATIDGLPAWPVFEVLVIALIVTGAIYYAWAVRGRAHDIEADVVTGEAAIG